MASRSVRPDSDARGAPEREPLALLRCRECLAADPDGTGATEPQRAGHGAVEVPVATADEGPAAGDRGHDAATAVADRHLRTAWQRAVCHAVVGVKAARGGAAVLVPRGVGLVVGVDHA